MKRFILLVILAMILSGCPINDYQSRSGLYIAGIESSVTKSVSVDRATGGLIVKEVYCFGEPVNSAWHDLVAVDDAGNAIESDTIQWSLDDPSLGTLEPAFMTPYARTFHPAEGSAGKETIVRATDGIYTDEAKIVIFNCKRILPSGASTAYFSFDRGCNVNTIEEADIAVKDGKFHFLNEWVKINQFESLDNLYALTGTEAQLGSPGTAILWPILFLTKSRNGALYGGLLATFDLAWKLITPAPSP